MGKESVEYTEKLTKEVKARQMIETEVEIASEIQRSILHREEMF